MAESNVNQQLPPRSRSHSRWPRKWATLGGCGSSSNAIPADDVDFPERPRTIDDRERRGRSLFRKSSTVGRNEQAPSNPDEIPNPSLKKSNSLINVLRSKFNSPTVIRRFRSKSRENSKQVLDDQTNEISIEKDDENEKDSRKTKEKQDEEKRERKSRKRDPSPMRRFANRVLQLARPSSQPRQTERSKNLSSQSPSKSRSKDSSIEVVEKPSTIHKNDQIDHINACYDEIRAKYFQKNDIQSSVEQNDETSKNDESQKTTFNTLPDDPSLQARKQANLKLNCMLNGYSLSSPFGNRERVFGDHYLFKFHHYYEVSKRIENPTTNKTRPISRSIDSFHRSTLAEDQHHIVEDQSTVQTEAFEPEPIKVCGKTFQDVQNQEENLLNSTVIDFSQSENKIDRTDRDELDEKFLRAVDRVLDLVKTEEKPGESSTTPEIIVTETDDNELFIREDTDRIEPEFHQAETEIESTSQLISDDLSSPEDRSKQIDEQTSQIDNQSANVETNRDQSPNTDENVNEELLQTKNESPLENTEILLTQHSETKEESPIIKEEISETQLDQDVPTEISERNHDLSLKSEEFPHSETVHTELAESPVKIEEISQDENATAIQNPSTENSENIDESPVKSEQPQETENLDTKQTVIPETPASNVESPISTEDKTDSEKENTAQDVLTESPENKDEAPIQSEPVHETETLQTTQTVTTEIPVANVENLIVTEEIVNDVLPESSENKEESPVKTEQSESPATTNDGIMEVPTSSVESPILTQDQTEVPSQEITHGLLPESSENRAESLVKTEQIQETENLESTENVITETPLSSVESPNVTEEVTVSQTEEAITEVRTESSGNAEEPVVKTEQIQETENLESTENVITETPSSSVESPNVTEEATVSQTEEAITEVLTETSEKTEEPVVKTEQIQETENLESTENVITEIAASNVENSVSTQEKAESQTEATAENIISENAENKSESVVIREEIEQIENSQSTNNVVDNNVIDESCEKNDELSLKTEAILTPGENSQSQSSHEISSVLNELVITEAFESNDEIVPTANDSLGQSVETLNSSSNDENKNSVDDQVKLVETKGEICESVLTNEQNSDKVDDKDEENLLPAVDRTLENAQRQQEEDPTEIQDEEVEKNLLQAVDRALEIVQAEENVKTSDNENEKKLAAGEKSDDSAYDEFERQLGLVLDENSQETSDHEENISDCQSKSSVKVETAIDEQTSSVSVDQIEKLNETCSNEKPSTSNNDDELERNLLKAVGRALDVVNADQIIVEETVQQSNINSDQAALNFSQITELATASIDKLPIFHEEQQTQIDQQESSIEQKSDSTSQLLDEQATVDQLISSIIDNVIEQIDTSRISNESVNRSAELD